MTEVEWFACRDPAPMLVYLRDAPIRGGNWIEQTLAQDGPPEHCSDRQVALFVVAVCNRVQHSPLNEPTLRGMAHLHDYSEGRISLSELLRLLGEVYQEERDGNLSGQYFPFYHPRVNEPWEARWIAEKVAVVTAWHVAREAIRRDAPDAYERCGSNWKTTGLELPEWQAAYREEELAQAALLREIVGNPFRPVAFDPAWRTSDATALARGIYEERAFDRMPILADALQDAGCTSDDVLNHLRDPHATHVRGCWALDLVLGKE